MGRSNTRFLRGLLLAALAVGLLALPEPGFAQKGKGKGKGKKADAAETATKPESAPAPAADDAQVKAKEHYTNGKALYEQGKYADAMAEFQTAYDLKPHPSVLKSIGECKVQIGDIPGAVATFEKYLADPAATKKDEVQAKITEIKAMMAQVEISSEPKGAGITIDGSVTDKVTPATIELTPGEHAIVLNSEGYEPLEKPLTLAKGARSKVAIDFAKEGKSTKAVTETALVDPFAEEGGAAPAEGGAIENEKEGPPAAFWIAAAVAGVGLVSGTVFGTMALGDEDDFNQKKKANPDETKDLSNIKDSGERNAIIADVSFGVAAAAAIVGVIILLTDKVDEKIEAGAATARRVQVVPVATGNAVGLSTAVSF
jgi:tetratricopeptide (TPR) repeat protein